MRRQLSLLVAGALLLGGCGQTATVDRGDPPEGVAPVYGSVRCTITSSEDEFADGFVIIRESYACIHEMSDPRVTGSESLPIVSHSVGNGGTFTVADAVLETDGGTWRGSGRGVFTFEPVLPEPLLPPINFGEMHYIGEGAYEGLEYRYYLSGSNYGLAIAGWISEIPDE